jgi:hypothetical protein
MQALLKMPPLPRRIARYCPPDQAAVDCRHHARRKRDPVMPAVH